MGFLGLVDTDEETNVPETPNNKVEPRQITPRGTGSGSSGVTVVRTNHEVVDEPFIEEGSSYNIVTLQPRSY